MRKKCGYMALLFGTSCLPKYLPCIFSLTHC